MNSLVCYGLRGGVGTTSVVAALGFALHELQQRVLLIDWGAGNMLGLHFNCPLPDVSTTHAPELDNRIWQVLPDLHVLTGPAPDDMEQLQDWLATQQQGSQPYNWVLFDAATACRASILQDSLPDARSLAITNVDAASHVLVHRHMDTSSVPLLVNRFIPESKLQNDLLTVWRHRDQPAVVPVILHRDESWDEALAHKLPVGLYRPQSQAAHEAKSLAIWCLAQEEARD